MAFGTLPLWTSTLDYRSLYRTMKGREFIASIGGAAGLPVVEHAQQAD
jgi:hypothetical protein